MTRFAFPFVTLLAFGCASAPTHSFEYDTVAAPGVPVATDRGPSAAEEELLAAPLAADAAETGFSFDAADLEESLDSQAAMPPPQRQRPASFVTIKGGYYSLEDTKKLDDGFIVNLSWTQFVAKNFASELEIGYVDADGEDSGESTDLWGIPFMANFRLNVPVSILDLYGGLGIGTIYYDVSGDVVSADGFVAAGDAFFGATATIGKAWAVGLEGKYYVTDSVSGLGGGLDAYAAMVTLSFFR